MMLEKFVDLTPSQVAHVIHDDIIKRYPDAVNATYVILGRPGPTGKTWLFKALRHYLGLKNVVEISEDINDIRDGVVKYGRGNYFSYNPLANQAVIVMNNPMNINKER